MEDRSVPLGGGLIRFGLTRCGESLWFSAATQLQIIGIGNNNGRGGMGLLLCASQRKLIETSFVFLHQEELSGVCCGGGSCNTLSQLTALRGDTGKIVVNGSKQSG
jgi:hypothetical protein